MSGALKNAEAGIAVSELQVWLLILFLFYLILFYFIQFYTFTWLLSWQILLVLFPPSLLLSRGKERVEENVFSYLKKYKFNPGQQKSWLQVLSMPRTHKDMMLRGLIKKNLRIPFTTLRIVHKKRSADLDCFPSTWRPVDQVTAVFFHFYQKPTKPNSPHCTSQHACSLGEDVCICMYANLFVWRDFALAQITFPTLGRNVLSGRKWSLFK